MAGPLSHIARSLKGTEWAGGRQANIPAPGHSRHDASISLGIGRNGQVIVNSFSTKGATHWSTILDELRRLGLIDAMGRPTHTGGISLRPQDEAPLPADRVARALELWAAGRPIAGSASEAYVRRRAVSVPLPPTTFRHLQETPISVFSKTSSAHRPALLVPILDPTGAQTAVEITYLTPAGRRDRSLNLSRKTVGPVRDGSAVRLDPLSEEMVFGEGVFTTYSARRRFRLPAWALTCTRNMRRFIPPPGLKRALIARDNGQDGEASARILGATMRRHGVRFDIVGPPLEYDDFNTQDQRERLCA